VLGPQSRSRLPYPETAEMLDVTPICTEHSGLNVNGDPAKTEGMLDRVLDRVGQAPTLEVIALENVPNFLSILDGQDQSSYTLWVEGLQECGFAFHAFVVMPTIVAGDLHKRCAAKIDLNHRISACGAIKQGPSWLYDTLRSMIRQQAQNCQSLYPNPKLNRDREWPVRQCYSVGSTTSLAPYTRMLSPGCSSAPTTQQHAVAGACAHTTG
jgi:hypothetical protein